MRENATRNTDKHQDPNKQTRSRERDPVRPAIRKREPERSCSYDKSQGWASRNPNRASQPRKDSLYPFDMMRQTATESRSRWRAAIVVALVLASSLGIFAAGSGAQGPAYDQYRLTTPGESSSDTGADAEARRRAGAIAATSRGDSTGGGAQALPNPAAVTPEARNPAAILADTLFSPAGAALGLLVVIVALAARHRRCGRRGIGTVSTLLISSAFVLAACGGGSESRPPLADGGFFGVQPRATPGAEDFKRMAVANVGTYRVFINWSTVQPSETESYDWRDLDDIFTRLAFYDIQPLPYIAGVPSWITDDVHDSPVASRKVRRGLRAFVRTAAQRYGRGSEFWSELNNSDLEIQPKPPLAWEVWNEQNSAFFWRPRPSTREYARLLRISATEIHDADPDAQIIVGGMFGTPPEPSSIDAWTFIRRLLRDPAIRALVDVVGVHPYAPEISGVQFQLEEMREALDEAGAEDTPLWITEVGWGSSPGGGLKKGSLGQAELLKGVFDLLEAERDRLGIEGVVWFTWRDVEGLPGRRTFNASSGLLSSSGEEKPAFRRYVEETGGS